MKIDILTLFPDMFSPLSESILGRAAENGLLEIRITNIRDHTLDKHKKTDDYPFGGGAGMVLYAEPVFRSLEAVSAAGKRILYMSPRGRLLDEPLIAELSREQELVILCGHYEGVDQRALDHWNMEEVSVGDYVLTGGELPAMVLIDAVARMIPEVLGNSEAHREESVYSGLLEYPQYTKPREYRGLEVPEVLLSGNHKMIHLWQLEQSMRLTKERRPDLWQSYLAQADGLSREEKKLLSRVLAEE